jgi:PqqD family protein of HPr-rel-A system
MPSFACVPGLRVEAIGDVWAAFSPTSGETLLLNDSSAAILEILASGPMEPDAVARVLAADAAVDDTDARQLLRDHWPKLVDAGLVREVAAADLASR